MTVRTLLLALAIPLVATTPASAALVVDTDALVRRTPEALGIVLTSVGRSRPSLNNPNPFNNRQVQTFTATRVGRLAAIDFQIFRNTQFDPGTLTLSLIEGDFLAGANIVRGQQDFAVGNLPTTTVAADIGQALRFDTSVFELDVVAGSRFSVLFAITPDDQASSAGLIIGNSLGVSQLPNGMFQVNVQRSNYAGGALVTLRSDGSPLPAGLNDLGFRTFIETSVPEPGSWAMLIAGFGLTGAALRRRRLIAA